MVPLYFQEAEEILILGFKNYFAFFTVPLKSKQKLIKFIMKSSKTFVNLTNILPQEEPSALYLAPKCPCKKKDVHYVILTYFLTTLKNDFA
jgi:hypothetical protein